MPFISISCLIALARTSSAILNRSENRHSCPVPDLRGKALSLSSLNMMLAVGFLMDALYDVEDVPFFF